MDPLQIAFGVLVLLCLLLIFGTVFFGFRRGISSSIGPSSDLGGFGILGVFGGLTTAFACATIASSSTTLGLVVGVGYALVAAALAKSGGAVRRVVELIRGLIEFPIGLLALIPASVRYFQAANDCTSHEVPTWYPIAVFVLILVAAAWAVVRGAASLIGARQFNGSTLRITLAIFSAFKIGLFFLSPFGLTFFDLPIAGWIVSFAGILLLLVGCLYSPKLIIPVGGIVIALSTVAVSASTGTACSEPGLDSAAILVTYFSGFLVTWFLLKKLLLDAVLKVPNGKD